MVSIEPGEFTEDEIYPTEETTRGVKFDNSGTLERCATNKCMPESLREKETLKIKLWFIDTGSAITGTAKINLYMYKLGDSGAIVDLFSTSLYVEVNAITTAILKEFNISNWIDDDTGVVRIMLSRNSADTDDTLVDSINLLCGALID